MIIVYNPQLEEPPMDKECTITFSNIAGAGGATTAVVLRSGVNRDVTTEEWEQINNRAIVQNHLRTGVLVVRDGSEETISEAASNVGQTTETIKNMDTLEDFKVPDAIEIVNATHEIDVLRRWFAKTERISLRNAITARLTAIEEANA
jgi:hypothetical protein